ncbi:MAG: Lpp/OprI family alanine-zipper lipoprotein [Gammaproteobacteria bacterium]
MMYKMIANVAKVSAIALAMGLAAGCATVDAERVNKDIADAAAQAQAAADRAAKAEQMAAEASRKADAAMEAAQAAQQCCDQTRESLDRMFKKAMQK